MSMRIRGPIMFSRKKFQPESLDELCADIAGLRIYHAEGVVGFFVMAENDSLVRFEPTKFDRDARLLQRHLGMSVQQNRVSGHWIAHLRDIEVAGDSFRYAVTALVAKSYRRSGG